MTYVLNENGYKTIHWLLITLATISNSHPSSISIPLAFRFRETVDLLDLYYTLTIENF